MSDDKKTPKAGGDVARRIWLAGIGAYGKAFEEGKAQLGKLGGSSSEVFDQLAEKGEKLELAAKVQGMKLAGKANEIREDIGVEDRISAMRERLTGAVPSLGSNDTAARLDRLEAQLASIEAKLDAVLKKSSSPKRATTTRTKKTPTKQAATKRATSKKSSS